LILGQEARVKRLLSCAAALALGAAAAYASHVPIEPDDVLELEARIAALFSYGELDPLVELRARIEGEDQELGLRSLTLGTYYRLHRNVKAGAFVRLQQGVLHDDDWIEESPGVWEWDDPAERTEVVAIADVTPRFQLDFLPGENWVVAVKARYELNTGDLHQSIKARPSLTYFWIVDRNPVLNATIAYEAYFPLNFGSTLLYEKWVYLNLLYHLTPTVKLEAGIARRVITWTDSEEFEDLFPAEDYEIDAKSWVIGLGVLWMIPL
jgi:hypothetical protein